jgi:heme/copper-type cytochrome/quinol oxidase subunit 3
VPTNTRQLFLWGLLASLCLTGAIAIGTLLFAEFDDRAGRILATTALLAVASLLGMPAGLLLDQGRARVLAWGLIGTVALGFALADYVVWSDGDPAWPWKLAVTFGVAAGAGAQAAVSTSRLRPDDARRLRALYWVAIALGVAFAVLVAVAAWKEIQDAEDYYRVLGATAVAAVLASLLQPLLRRASRRPEPRLRLVLELDREPTDEAVAAAVEALARHGVRAEGAVKSQV